MNRKLKRFLFIAVHGIGFFLLWFILKDIDWQRFTELIPLFPVWKFAVGISILLCVYLLKSLRWYLINKSFGIELSYSKSLTYYLVSGFLGSITPGRLGEFSKVYFLNRSCNVSMTRGTTSVFLDRIWDVMVLSLMAVIAIVFLFSSFSIGIEAIIIILILFVITIIIILFPNAFFNPAIFISSRWPVFQKELINIAEFWKKERAVIFIPAFFLSLAAFLLLAIIPVIFSTSLNATVPYHASVSAVSISNILSFIPITIAGIGTRELVFIKVWEMLNHNAETALTVSTAYFIVTYLGSIFLGGSIYFFSFKKHFSLKQLKEEKI
jgi:uncharacterized protein (TIRG00374 family)